MKNYTATDAKSRFGEVLDTAMHEPVQIERNGRPIAVVLSSIEFQSLQGEAEIKKKQQQARKQKALQFMREWMQQPPIRFTEEQLKDDPRLAALVEKHVSL